MSDVQVKPGKGRRDQEKKNEKASFPGNNGAKSSLSVNNGAKSSLSVKKTADDETVNVKSKCNRLTSSDRIAKLDSASSAAGGLVENTNAASIDSTDTSDNKEDKEEKLYDDPTKFWAAWSARRDHDCVEGSATNTKGCQCFEGLGSIM